LTSASGGTSTLRPAFADGRQRIRRDLGAETIREVSALLKESIQYSLDNREDALQYAMQFARDMDTALADQFVGMWSTN